MVHRQQKVSHWTRPPNTPTYRNMWKFSTTWKNHTMQGGMRNVQISTEKGGGLRVMKSRSNVLIYEQNTHQIPPPFCSLLTFGQEIHHEGQNCRHGGKMCGCYSVTCLSWTPILDWCVWLSENQITNITKTCVWKRLGSIFNFLLTHVTIDIEHNLEGMFVFS